MDSAEITFLEELRYGTDKDNTIRQLSTIDNPLFLQFFAANYNWNNRFNVPKALLNNEHCDLGTGLLMFYDTGSDEIFCL